MRDSEIEQWVVRHLGLPELADSREVCVLSREGIVTLYGSVTNQQCKRAVHRAARDAKGVIAVINKLQAESSETGLVTISLGVSAPPSARRAA